jgi:SOS-response transcriptional repressor LexA
MILCMSDPVMAAVERMRKALTRYGVTPSKAATLAQMDRSKVYDWWNGNSRPQQISEVERVISAVTTYAADPSSKKAVRISRGGVRMIPVLPGLNAGVPTQSHADLDEIEVLDWGTDRERWGRVIDGDSMYPLLVEGDLVVFEDRPAEPNHVVHAVQDDENDTVKVYRRSGGTASLVPTNDSYEPTPMNGTWIVKGVAVQVIRKLPRDEKMTMDYPHGMRFRD